jgi:hypothetical protein
MIELFQVDLAVQGLMHSPYEPESPEASSPALHPPSVNRPCEEIDGCTCMQLILIRVLRFDNSVGPVEPPRSLFFSTEGCNVILKLGLGVGMVYYHLIARQYLYYSVLLCCLSLSLLSKGIARSFLSSSYYSVL